MIYGTISQTNPFSIGEGILSQWQKQGQDGSNGWTINERIYYHWTVYWEMVNSLSSVLCLVGHDGLYVCSDFFWWTNKERSCKFASGEFYFFLKTASLGEQFPGRGEFFLSGRRNGTLAGVQTGSEGGRAAPSQAGRQKRGEPEQREEGHSMKWYLGWRRIFLLSWSFLFGCQAVLCGIRKQGSVRATTWLAGICGLWVVHTASSNKTATLVEPWVYFLCCCSAIGLLEERVEVSRQGSCGARECPQAQLRVAFESQSCNLRENVYSLHRIWTVYQTPLGTVSL